MQYVSIQISSRLNTSPSCEGNVFWTKRSELGNYPLAETFDQLIRVFEDDLLGEQYFHWDGDVFKRELI